MIRPEPTLTRRRLLQSLALGFAPLATGARLSAASPAPGSPIGPLGSAVLPAGLRARFVDDVNGLRMHVLEAGFETPGRPALLLIHGFPELAYSWRHIMGPLAAAGYHVFAPDVRGYGRTTPSPVGYDDDLLSFRTANKIRDMLALVAAMGHQTVAAVIGHDQGSPLAGWCACAHPRVFPAVVLMSAPFTPTPAPAPGSANGPRTAASGPETIYDDLARLTPPRKHYQRYYQTREANENMWRATQGLHAFLRAYFHMKSADWPHNNPHPLNARTADEWAKLPRYYIMDLSKGMAEQVAAEMPSAAEIARNRWLPDDQLRVYAEEYGRTGFQGGLNGYRRGPIDRELQAFAGRALEVPALFLGGAKDWGVYQSPGALERLEHGGATKYFGTHLVAGAGHWVQQEQPDQVSRLLLDFLKRAV